jgi:hypothetical protein
MADSFGKTYSFNWKGLGHTANQVLDNLNEQFDDRELSYSFTKHG